MTSKPEVISVIIADDEPPALRKLENWVKERADFRLLSVCKNGEEVLSAFRQNPADLLLLDIEMPGYSGMEVLDQLAEGVRPVVVFVTAYTAYALPAYERGAIAYLLKPFDRVRLNACLDSAKAQVLGQAAAAGQHKDKPQKAITRLAVPTNKGETRFLVVSDVYAFKAEGNYVSIIMRDAKYLMRITMKTLEKRLDAAHFVRSHRSIIINVAKVKSMRSVSHGDSLLQLENGLELPLSRTYRSAVLSLLPGSV